MDRAIYFERLEIQAETTFSQQSISAIIRVGSIKSLQCVLVGVFVCMGVFYYLYTRVWSI